MEEIKETSMKDKKDDSKSEAKTTTKKRSSGGEPILRGLLSSKPQPLIPSPPPLPLPLPRPLPLPLPRPLTLPLPLPRPLRSIPAAAGVSSGQPDGDISFVCTMNVPVEEGASTSGTGCQEQDDTEVSNDESEHPEASLYKIISSEAAYLEMYKITTKVRELTNERHESIRKLMTSYSWNVEPFLQDYFADKLKLFHNLKVEVVPISSRFYGPFDEDIEKCIRCDKDYDTNDVWSLLCQHKYCKKCWGIYLASQVREDEDITCPQQRCHVIVQDSEIVKGLQGRKVPLGIYCRRIAHYFILCTPNYRWCQPTLTKEKQCTNAFEIDNPKSKWMKMECTCGHILCSDCDDDWHYPIKCPLLSFWRQKYAALLQTNPSWKIAGIARCPHCQTPNQKFGSNLLSCHNTKDCNKKYYTLWQHPFNYREECEPDEFTRFVVQPGPEGQQRDRFYFYRFTEHQDSLNREKDNLYKKRARIAAKQLGELQKKDKQREPRADPDCPHPIVKAVQHLADGRRMVMYSYVFAYYGVESEQLDTFLDSHGTLEHAVEDLSVTIREFLKRPMTGITEEFIEDLEYKSEWMEDLRKDMVEQVTKGYEANTWVFITG